MVAFTGRCLAHRAGMMQFHGEWRDALEEAKLARERCEEAMNRAAAGQALYQQGELHRLLGDFESAETAYRTASGYGREPQPGLALLRLVQGDADAAAGISRRASASEGSSPASRVLPAHVEIMLAAGDLDEARRAPRSCRRSRPQASARCSRRSRPARGVRSSSREGNAEAALKALRHACRTWQELDAPYEVARTRALIGLACERLGDEESAELELDAARERLRAARRGARSRPPGLAGTPPLPTG